MSNYIDYLKWRGDIPFSASEFCEIDAMILSELVYINMDGMVCEDFEFGEADCACISHRYIMTRDPKDTIGRNLYSVAEAVLEAPRFSGVKICGYRDVTDTEKQQQFAAATFMLGEGLYFVAFRGTDNTIVSWRENMDLSYNEEVPSQKAAVAYLNEAVKKLKGKFITGGHSKGGNLAVYAAAFSFKKTSKQVRAVYNFDGPGFNDIVLDKKGFHDISDKVHTFVPQNSLIGMLLKHKEPYTVIRSTRSTGVTQHQMDTWLVGPHMIEQADDLTVASKFMNENIAEWIESMTHEEKKQFIDIVFGLVDDLDTVDDLFSARNLRMIMKAYSALDEESKQKISGVLGGLQDTVKENIKEHFRNTYNSIFDK